MDRRRRTPFAAAILSECVMQRPSWTACHEEITVAVNPEDLQDGDESDPEQHPIAIALRRQRSFTARSTQKA